MNHGHQRTPLPADATEDHVYECDGCDGAIVPSCEQVRSRLLPDYCDDCSAEHEAKTFATRLSSIFSATGPAIPCPDCDGEGGTKLDSRTWHRCESCDGCGWAELAELEEAGASEPGDEFAAGIYRAIQGIRELPWHVQHDPQTVALVALLKKEAVA